MRSLILFLILMLKSGIIRLLSKCTEINFELYSLPLIMVRWPTISTGVLRGLLGRTDEWGWRIPYVIHWVWHVPITIFVLFAPESPWWLVRHGKVDEAKSHTTPGLNYSSAALLPVFVFTYDLTVSHVTYCLISEIPSTRLRIKSAVLARNCYNIASIIANFLNPPILNPTAWNLKGKGGSIWAPFCLVCFVIYQSPKDALRLNSTFCSRRRSLLGSFLSLKPLHFAPTTLKLSLIETSLPKRTHNLITNLDHSFDYSFKEQSD